MLQKAADRIVSAFLPFCIKTGDRMGLIIDAIYAIGGGYPYVFVPVFVYGLYIVVA